MILSLRSLGLLGAAVVAACLVLFPTAFTLDSQKVEVFIDHKRELTEDRRAQKEVSEEERLAALAAKLNTPRELSFDSNDPNKLATHQFLHLHHMKTGGTSLDYYLECARYRLMNDKGFSIPYGSLHECDTTYYDRCKAGLDTRCLSWVSDAAMLSYCAPLKDLPYFTWGAQKDGINITVSPSHGAITVLRHPVDRVWSMYRFQTDECYNCMPLIEIYQQMDIGNLTGVEPHCAQQLRNHQVTNLLSTEWLAENDSRKPGEAYDDGKLAEAIENMKSFFTVIGLTEHLDATIAIAGRVFPWLKPQVEWSAKECTISHANSSPRYNGCSWDLPSHPDEETRAAIEAHNQLDLKLYAAAVEHFELQKRAIGLDEKGTQR